ncbi:MULTISPECIES: MaoC family dehydratase [Sphingobium]|jgi:acyl dehydratase|uniref:Acyl dehydratase n=1 Tax=Sphingobium fuliginis (strain ATCC 27551) TaxID=336203 RepID=A0A292ZEK7_SPHSA|nr:MULTISPECIES: MaoC family dehydratase [Sphingobium]OAP33911.1 acyl dehydratase [Sphingobium sp. 20006FA]KXU31409.1 acyl dehydratase [Sphingobium sp. AM]KYC34299.1 acyl dehydratase [Sphingobium sp. 22B]QOT72725.1 MaoC family dehydratase [Sphingobium fuliginis]GAY21294.1 acyl dehydratase [Sphingobium fuliginis]
MSEIVYFEDVQVGDRNEFGPLTISREEIVAFASEFDPQPFHLSDEAAAGTHFGSLASSGWHTTALSMKMMVAEWQRNPGIQAASLGAMGVDELRWLQPVRPGDTLRGVSEVIEVKASRSRPEMGIVKTHITLFNQRDEPVLSMKPIAMFRTRPT